MKSICNKIYIELNNKNRILEHLIRNFGEMIDNNEEKINEIDMLEDFNSLYEALNSLTEQYKNLEENLVKEIQNSNNKD